MALLSGDPFKAAPHFHLTDEHVEVKQGTFLVGMDDEFDLEKTTPMIVGDTGTAPAGTHHYAAAKGRRSSP
jgi:mannose-6-phosphate isomerase-like protein (cupin superfamily)